MQQYHSVVKNVLESGTPSEDRTKVGTISTFGEKMEFKYVKSNFPLLATKYTYWAGVVKELLWFISGSTDVNVLKEQGVNIWNEWAGQDGTIGPLYGAMWRSWPNGDGTHVDQLQNIINTLRTNPESRRMCMSVWNPSVLPDEGVSPSENVDAGKQALAPCHPFIQFYSRKVGDYRFLNLQVYIRSNDLFLGAPFNIASYALLLCMVAHITGHETESLHYVIGDAHIYSNHMDQVAKMQNRWDKGSELIMDNKTHIKFEGDIKEIGDFTIDNIILQGYEPLSPIPAPVAV